MFRRAAAAALALVPTLWLLAPGAAGADTAEQTGRRVPVAPGVSLSPVSVPGAEGTKHFSTLRVDLSGPAEVSYLQDEGVTDPTSLAQMPAPEGTVAAVNGDFFDIGASGAPLGAAVRDGTVLKSPVAGHRNVAVFGPSGRGGIHTASFSGTAALPGPDIAIDQLNSHRVPADGTGVFTSAWGGHTRQRPAGSGPVTELVISDGTVRRVRESAGTGRIEPGSRVLLGRGAAAERLAEIPEGAAVKLDYTLRAGEYPPETAIGGRHVLLRDGELTGAGGSARHPRTAIGFSRDGRRMFLVVADGRAPGTRGATLDEMAERLLRLGADDALELDGGGSSTLLAREPGTDVPITRNRPGEPLREVPNGLAVHVPTGDGAARGVWVRPEIRSQPERGSVLTARPDPYRVFSGFTRALTARAYDSAYGPAPEERLTWSARGGGVEEGVFRAGAPGEARVKVRTGGGHGGGHGYARGGVGLRVLPRPERLETEPTALSFPDGSGSAEFVIDGVAPDGTRAPVEPADAEITVDPDLAAITRRDDGTVLVEPTAESGTGTITVEAGKRSAAIPLGIGAQTVRLADFDDAGSWTVQPYRAASADASPASGHTGRGLALSYDFTGEPRSRAAYMIPPAPLPVERTAFGFRLWMHGDGNGALPALTVTDSAGRSHSCYGPRVTWQGWRKVDITVPEGIAHPVEVERVYLVETRSDHQYSGRVVIDDLTASAALEG